MPPSVSTSYAEACIGHTRAGVRACDDWSEGGNHGKLGDQKENILFINISSKKIRKHQIIVSYNVQTYWL